MRADADIEGIIVAPNESAAVKAHPPGMHCAVCFREVHVGGPAAFCSSIRQQYITGINELFRSECCQGVLQAGNGQLGRNDGKTVAVLWLPATNIDAS